jgi:glycosyltransferase involved in cell wall biosynthesis
MNAPLRVLHVIPSVSPLRGGPSKAVLEMVLALRRQGVEAAILTTNDHGPAVDSSLPTGRWIQWQGVPLLAFPRWSPPLRSLREYAISPGLALWLVRHVHRYDLLHVHALFSFPSTWAMATARRAQVPYLARTIGMLSPWSLGQSPARKRWMLRLLERRNLNGAHALHFTTDSEREEAQPLGLRCADLVVPLGVELPPLAPGWPQGEPPGRDPEGGEAQPGSPGKRPTRFLFLSRLHRKKQLENLLDALALVRQQRPEAAWQLRIAGRGEPDYEASLHWRAQQRGLESHCRWLGQVDGAQKQAELAGADWLVLPSAAENFGIAVVEALAAGTPAILSPQVAVAAMVAEAGAGLVSSSDPASLARTLQQALGGPPTATRLAARSLAQERLAWPAIATNLAGHYRRIVAAGSAPCPPLPVGTPSTPEPKR